MKIDLKHPGGNGSTQFEIEADGHEVVMRHPIRTELGSSMWLNRFTPEEALVVAEALADAAGLARPGPPEIRD